MKLNKQERKKHHWTSYKRAYNETETPWCWMNFIERGSKEQNEQEEQGTRLNHGRKSWMDKNVKELDWTSYKRAQSNWTGYNRNNRNWTRFKSAERNWTNMNRKEFYWTCEKKPNGPKWEWTSLNEIQKSRIKRNFIEGATKKLNHTLFSSFVLWSVKFFPVLVCSFEPHSVAFHHVLVHSVSFCSFELCYVTFLYWFSSFITGSVAIVNKL